MAKRTVRRAGAKKPGPRPPTRKKRTPKTAVEWHDTAERHPQFSIVGIGASAGGFEAFAHLLDALPADPKLTIVFVQHLAPKHASALPALLSAHSKLPVSEAVE